MSGKGEDKSIGFGGDAAAAAAVDTILSLSLATQPYTSKDPDTMTAIHL